jgi:hypothetical protein
MAGVRVEQGVHLSKNFKLQTSKSRETSMIKHQFQPSTNGAASKCARAAMLWSLKFEASLKFDYWILNFRGHPSDL